MDREAWRAAIHGVVKSWTQLSDWTELCTWVYNYAIYWTILLTSLSNFLFTLGNIKCYSWISTVFTQLSGPCYSISTLCYMGLPRRHSGEESTRQAGDTALIPGLGRSPGEGNGNSLQYSCLGNPMDRGGWWATVCRVTKTETWLSRHKVTGRQK